MARAGLRPLSLFIQLRPRIDQVMYDIGLHGLPVVICIDRAGAFGPDGALITVSMTLRCMRCCTRDDYILSSSLQELLVMMNQASERTGL